MKGERNGAEEMGDVGMAGCGRKEFSGGFPGALVVAGLIEANGRAHQFG